MRTEQITLYTFNELDDIAKERAREWWRNGFASDLAWSDESLASIKAFCTKYGVRLTDWSVGPWESPLWTIDACNDHFRGLKLRSVVREEYPTGYCLDGTLSITFHDHFKRTGNALGAFNAALDAGFIAWRNDMEYQYSDEYIDDMLICNEYEFTVDGEWY